MENLTDDKKLRDALVLFSIDEQNSVILPEHRQQLIPIVMKFFFLLFFLLNFSLLGGQFYAHVAVRGKSKRMAIFNFLASCKSEELDIFFNIVFGVILNFISKFCLLFL